LTFKDLETQIQKFSRNNPVFKDFQNLEFKEKKFKDSQKHSRMRGNFVISLNCNDAISLLQFSTHTVNWKKTLHFR